MLKIKHLTVILSALLISGIAFADANVCEVWSVTINSGGKRNLEFYVRFRPGRNVWKGD